MSLYENTVSIDRLQNSDRKKGRCLLYVPLEENACISLRESAIPLQAGDCLLLQPDTPHTLAAQPGELLCISWKVSLMVF